jgi:hypothetical protein
MATLGAFAWMSEGILSRDWNRSLMTRLESEAALLEEYLSSNNSFQDHSSLERLCRSLNIPRRHGERVSIFNPDGRIIADSRSGAAFQRRTSGSQARPEVAKALEKEVGRNIRFSRGSNRTMAFVAYPHVHLGAVTGVIRLGTPVSGWRNPVWMAYLKIAAVGILFSLLAAVLQGPIMRLYFLFRGN